MIYLCIFILCAIITVALVLISVQDWL